MLSIPATKGFEIGSGFAGSKMRGSAHKGEFVFRFADALGSLPHGHQAIPYAQNSKFVGLQGQGCLACDAFAHFGFNSSTSC